MKFQILLVFVLVISLNLFSQDEIVSTEAKESRQEFLVGVTERNTLQTGDFGEHFLDEYKNYLPEMNILNEIGHHIFSYEITLVMATWCHDSQEQVPRFFKIMDIINYNTNHIKIICVDKEKSGGNTDISNLNIELVPTFVFYKNEVEKGRIIETPVNTIENDILSILKE